MVVYETPESTVFMRVCCAPRGVALVIWITPEKLRPIYIRKDRVGRGLETPPFFAPEILTSLPRPPRFKVSRDIVAV